MFDMQNRMLRSRISRVARLSAPLIFAACAMTACYIPHHHPAFGAKDFQRVADTQGVPTYTIEGNSYYGMDPARDAAKIAAAACPKGNPVILGGMATTFNGTDRNGSPQSGIFWDATFTCNDVIAIPE
jgi:hypothetical protein